MKSVNNFQVTGFVVNDAVKNEFKNAQVARFGLSIARTEGKDENKKRTSAILNVEIWRGNKNAADLDLLKKGNRLRGTEITTGDDEEEAPETTEEA